MGEQLGSRSIAPAPVSDRPNYSICTLVTKRDEYAEMITSFRAGGFIEAEFMHVDNSEGNIADAYTALNLFLNEANGLYIIICHQDVLLLDDGREKLDECISGLNRNHPNWALAGNAGVTLCGKQAIRITDPNGDNQARGGPFPIRAAALDENFIIAKRSANLAVSRDLCGFHLYGTDICLQADALGWEAHVIDFHLHHKSAGNIDSAFGACHRAISDKYMRLMKPRWLPSIFGVPIYLGPSRVRRFIAWSMRKAGIGRFNRV